MTTTDLPTRLPRWMLVRQGSSLPVERMRLRLAAFVYGGILVLGAVAVATGETIASGHAAIVVAATTVTTYLAHIVAHMVGEQVGRAPGAEREHVARGVRDSLPILFAGIVPIIVLFLPVLTRLPTQSAQLIAGAWIVLQFSLLGLDVARISGRRPTLSTFWAGILLAIVAATIVVVKTLLLH